jgi:hypothetical protein
MKLRVTTVCLCLLFALSSSKSALAQSDGNSNAWQGTVNLDSATLYAGVSASTRVVTQLNRGDAVVIKMEITGADGKWYAVTTAGESGTSGYLSGKALDIQEPASITNWEYVPPPMPTVNPGASAAEEESDVVARSQGKMFGDIKPFFLSKFGRTLPVSAFGQTRLHSRLGFDHRNSVDVALSPDSREGRALLGKLRAFGVPFITFRKAIPGIATGAHIHIGRPSPRR